MVSELVLFIIFAALLYASSHVSCVFCGLRFFRPFTVELDAAMRGIRRV